MCPSGRLMTPAVHRDIHKSCQSKSACHHSSSILQHMYRTVLVWSCIIHTVGFSSCLATNVHIYSLLNPIITTHISQEMADSSHIVMEMPTPSWLAASTTVSWLAVSTAIFVFLSKLYTFAMRPKDYPPGPPTTPVVGNLLQMPTIDTHLTFEKWAKQCKFTSWMPRCRTNQ